MAHLASKRVLPVMMTGGITHPPPALGVGKWRQILSASTRVCVTQQVATMKATHGEKYPYSKPWPYATKRFRLWHEFFDSSIARWNENSRIIIVEGNYGVGKDDFARKIAKNFDLRYFPAVPESEIYTNQFYRFDMRKMNEMLPEDVHFYDLTSFLTDPTPEKGKASRLLLNWYKAKYFNYVMALRHLLNTGQGVVVTSSAYSDHVWAHALATMKWITPKFKKYYFDVHDNSLCELMKPHLTIFLDAPVSVLRERIKARNKPNEVNSKNLSDEFLSAADKYFRSSFLPNMRKSGEVMELDWTEPPNDMDVDVIVEEIQKLEFLPEDKEDTKYDDWFEINDDKLAVARRKYSDNRIEYFVFSREVPIHCPEMLIRDDDEYRYEQVINKHPVNRYMPGWTPELGNRTALKLW